MFSANRSPIPVSTPRGYRRMTLEHAVAADLLLLHLGPRRLEDRRLGHLGADDVADHDDDGGEPESDAPAPGQEALRRQGHGHDPEHHRGQQVAHRNRRLRPGGPEAAAAVRAVLGHQHHGTAPFPTQREALDEAQRHQQDWSPDADRGEGGQAAHQHGGRADHENGGLQRLLAAQLVPDVAEDHAAQRPGNEADGVGQEGGDDAVVFIAHLGQQHLAENQGSGGGVEEEVVPLHHSAGHRGGDDPLQRRRPALSGFLPGPRYASAAPDGSRAAAVVAC